MGEKIVVLHEDDLRALLQESAQQAAAAVLQGLALSLSGGASAAAAAATRKVTAGQVFGSQQLLALPGVEPATPAKKGRPQGTKNGEGKKTGSRKNYDPSGRVILPMDAPGDWISPMEASKVLGISDAAVYFSINAGRFPAKYRKEGGSLMVRREDVLAYKRDKGDTIKKNQRASKKTKRQAPPPHPASPGWLNLPDTMRALGMSASQVKSRREAGALKARRNPAAPKGEKTPYEFEQKSVEAMKAKG